MATGAIEQAVIDALRNGVDAVNDNGNVQRDYDKEFDDLKTDLESNINILSNTVHEQVVKQIQAILPQLIRFQQAANSVQDATDRNNINAKITNLQDAIRRLLESDTLTNANILLNRAEAEKFRELINSFNANLKNLTSEAGKRASSNNIFSQIQRVLGTANGDRGATRELSRISSDIQGQIDVLTREHVEQNASLIFKVLQDQLKDTKHFSDEFQQSLQSIFNFQFKISDSNIAQVFESINKSSISAAEAIKSLQNTFQNNQFNDPQAISGTLSQSRSAREELEKLSNSLVQDDNTALANIVKTSLGEISSFYSDLLNMSVSYSSSLNNFQHIIQTTNMSTTTQATLQREVDLLKEHTDTIIQTANSQLSKALTTRITNIIDTIDKNEDSALTLLATSRGLGNRYISNLRHSGNTAAELWQNATGIEQLGSRFSAFGINFGGSPNFRGLKKDLSAISQIEFELGSGSKNVIGLFEQANKLERQGKHAEAEKVLEQASKNFPAAVTLQAELSKRAIASMRRWNQLSKKTKKQLDPSGQMDRQMRTLGQTVGNNNAILLQLQQAAGIKLDPASEKKLRQLKNDTRELKNIDNEMSKTEEKSKRAMTNISQAISSSVHSIQSTISSARSLLDRFGGLGIALSGPIATLTKTYEYYRQQGQARYVGMGTDAYIGYTDLDDSARRTQRRLMEGNELYVLSGGRINRDVVDKQYQSILRQVGEHYGSTPEQAAQDAEELTRQTVLMKNIYGIDDSTMNQAIKTFYKDMNMTVDDTRDAIMKLSTQAQAANIPLNQYLSKVTNLAQQFMKIGIEGTQAGTILNNLVQRGIRVDVAEELASQTASSMGKFAENKNKVAFAATMLGQGPFEGIARAAYTHDAKGNPRREWAQDVAAYMDTYFNTIMPAYGSDPSLRRMGATDLFKEMGFNQMKASMLASAYLEHGGSSSTFQDMLLEAQEQLDNPNKKLEDLNGKMLSILEKMTGQLAEGDRLKARLDSQLYTEATHIGVGIDTILHEISPMILEFQKQMLKFVMEALKLAHKFVTSDLFKTITDTIIKAIGNIPKYLSSAGDRIDDAFKSIQDSIEGRSSTEESASSDMSERNHLPWDPTTKTASNLLGLAAFIKAKGGLPGKIIAGLAATQISDRILHFITDLAAKKDSNGRILRDSSGQIIYKDDIASQSIAWLTSPERFWNGDHDYAGTAVAGLSLYSMARALPRIGVGGFGSAGALLARGGAYGAAIAGIGALGYGAYQLLSYGLDQGMTNIENDGKQLANSIGDPLNFAASTAAGAATVRAVNRSTLPPWVKGAKGKAAIFALTAFGVTSLIDFVSDKLTNILGNADQTVRSAHNQTMVAGSQAGAGASMMVNAPAEASMTTDASVSYANKQLGNIPKDQLINSEDANASDALLAAGIIFPGYSYLRNKFFRTNTDTNATVNNTNASATNVNAAGRTTSATPIRILQEQNVTGDRTQLRRLTLGESINSSAASAVMRNNSAIINANMSRNMQQYVISALDKQIESVNQQLEKLANRNLSATDRLKVSELNRLVNQQILLRGRIHSINSSIAARTNYLRNPNNTIARDLVKYELQKLTRENTNLYRQFNATNRTINNLQAGLTSRLINESGNITRNTNSFFAKTAGFLDKLRIAFFRGLGRSTVSLGTTIVETSASSTAASVSSIANSGAITQRSIIAKYNPIGKLLEGLHKGLASIANKLGIAVPRVTSSAAAPKTPKGLLGRFGNWLGQTKIGGALARNFGPIMTGVVAGIEAKGNYDRGDSLLESIWHTAQDSGLGLAAGFVGSGVAVAALAAAGITALPILIGGGLLAGAGAGFLGDTVNDMLQGQTDEQREQGRTQQRIQNLLGEGFSAESAQAIALGQVDKDQARIYDRQVLDEQLKTVEEQKQADLAAGTFDNDAYQAELARIEEDRRKRLQQYQQYDPYGAHKETYLGETDPEKQQQLLADMIYAGKTKLSTNYQAVADRIANSNLPDDKKKEALNLFNTQYNEQRALFDQTSHETDNNKIIQIMDDVNRKQKESISKISEMTGLDVSDILGKDRETKDEADKSRHNVWDKYTKKINREQYEQQRLQKITIQTIEDFMDLHEKLMSMLQKSITHEHEDLFKMVAVTHRILVDLRNTIVRAGSTVFAAIMAYGGGGGSPSVGTSPSSTTPSKIDANASETERGKFIFNSLLRKNWDRVHAAAVVGNAYQESNWDPNCITGDAHGIMQWRLDRFENLKNFAAARNKPWTDLATQIDFLDYEARNGSEGEYLTKSGFWNETDLDKATVNFRKTNLRPGESEANDARRISGAHTAMGWTEETGSAPAPITADNVIWQNDTEKQVYEILKNDLKLENGDIAGLLGTIDYYNSNFDTEISDKHGGIFALGGSQRQKVLERMAQTGDNSLRSQILAAAEVLNIRPSAYARQELKGTDTSLNLLNQWSADMTDRKRVADRVETRVKQLAQATSTPTSIAVGNHPSERQVRIDAKNSNNNNGTTLPLYNQNTDIHGGHYTPDVACTPTSAAMVITAWTGETHTPTELNSSEIGWDKELDKYAQLHDFYSQEDFNKAIEAHFSQNPNTPLFLYQTGGAGRHGSHKLNAFSGDHAVVIARRLPNGQYEIYNPAGGQIQVLNLDEIYDPSAKGGQAMDSGNALWIPKNAVGVTNFGGGSKSPSANNPVAAGNRQQIFLQMLGVGQQYINGNPLNLAQEYERVGLGSVAEQEQLLNDMRKRNEAYSIANHSPKAEVDERAKERAAAEQNAEKAADGKSAGDKATGTDTKAKAKDERYSSDKNVKLDEDIITKYGQANNTQDFVNILKNEYTGIVDTNKYKERLYQEQFGKEERQLAEYYKQARMKFTSPTEIMNSNIADLGITGLEVMNLNAPSLDIVSSGKSKPKFSFDIENITNEEAAKLARAEMKRRAIQSTTDSNLLKYFGISSEDEQVTTELAKLIRAGKDLEGNKITDQQLQKMLQEHSTWSEDQARAEIYRITNRNQNVQFKQTNEKDPIIGDIYDLFNIQYSKDWKQLSKNIETDNIIRSKKETEIANIQVQGFEKGKEISFWTDEHGAEQFYQNQARLYATGKEDIYQQNLIYKRLRNREILRRGMQTKEGKTLVDTLGKQAALEKFSKQLNKLVQNQINAEIYKQMSTMAEFNMTGHEYADILGIKMDPTAPERVYDELLHNAQLGLSPSGEDWQEALDKKEQELLTILNSSRQEDQKERQRLQEQLNKLAQIQINMGRDINDQLGQLGLLARSELLRENPEKYGKMNANANPRLKDMSGVRAGTVMDDKGKVYEGMDSFGWGDYTAIDYGELGADALQARQSYLAKNPTAQIYLGFQHSNPYYGNVSGGTYGGISGVGLVKSMSNIMDKNGMNTKMLNIDFNEWFRQINLVRARTGVLSSGGETTAVNYRGFVNNAIARTMDKSITGVTEDAREKAKLDREASRALGTLKRGVNDGSITVTRGMQKVREGENIVPKKKINIQGHIVGLTKKATEMLENAIRRAFEDGINPEDLTIDLKPAYNK